MECVEVNGTTENYKNNVQAALLVSCSTQTDNEDFEYLDMNFKYPLVQIKRAFRLTLLIGSSSSNTTCTASDGLTFVEIFYVR